MAEKRMFEGLRDALKEGVEDLRRNRKLTVRDVVLPDPPRSMSPGQITRLRRRKLAVSQAVFARLMNTAPQTVHAWEQGRNKPSGSALRLLRLVDESPELFTELLEMEE